MSRKNHHLSCRPSSETRLSHTHTHTPPSASAFTPITHTLRVVDQASPWTVSPSVQQAFWQEKPMNWCGSGVAGGVGGEGGVGVSSTPSGNLTQSSIYVLDRRNTHQPFLYFAFA